MLKARFNRLFYRFISCKSCGIDLQSEFPKEIGYYLKPKEKKVNVKSYTLENLKYLLFSQDIQVKKHNMNMDDIDSHNLDGKTIQRIICKRCSDAIHKNQYHIEEFQRYSYTDIKNVIPYSANIYHVVSLADFPLTLDINVLSNNKTSNYLLLSKADQITPKQSLLTQKATLFFKAFCKYQLDINVCNIVSFSSVKNWNISSVLNALKKSSYLVGNTNVGKSSLVNTLMSKSYNPNDHLEKYQDDKKSSPTTFTCTYNKKDFLKLNSAGVSYIPNFTRSIQSYKIKNKILYDLPGYTKDITSPDYLTIIDKKFLERIRKTSLFKTSKLNKKSYISFKGTENGKCITVGGLFYLVAPPNSTNQLVNYIPGENYQFSSIDKALDVVKRVHQNPNDPLRKFIGVLSKLSDKSEYTRHILPPFQGSIEVVLKDIGYFQLKCTGTYEYRGLYEIYVPKGIDVCIREPLFKLINMGFERYIESKGKISACPRDRPIISSTYPMSHDEIPSLEKLKDMFLQRTERDILARRLINQDPIEIISKHHNIPPNIYWYYVW